MVSAGETRVTASPACIDVDTSSARWIATATDRGKAMTTGSARLVYGDMLDALPMMRAESFDSCVTDPPYGLGFMGRQWDHGVPGATHWEAVSRVMVPGGWLVAFGGTRKYHRLVCAIEDAGFEIIDTVVWLYGTGKPASKSRLKPAWEPITIARKPGGIPWMGIEACRVNPGSLVRGRGNGMAHHGGRHAGGQGPNGIRPLVEPHTAGRWPANVVLDEEAGAMLDEQTGNLPNGYRKNPSITREQGRVTYGKFEDYHLRGERGYPDIGGASRFFYCAKASTKERGVGNMHPTVKPVTLMRWLVRLVTPEGGRVLDPFLGSGTTLLACLDEGMRGTGIDSDRESVRTARSRIEERGT